MQSFERIRIIRAELKMNQTDFGKSINLAQSTMGQIENGTRRLTERVLDDICRVHNVNKEWFLYGKGEIFEKTPTSTMEQLKKEFQLDEFAYSFVYEYLKLDNEKRNAVQNFFHDVINRTNVCTNMKNSESETTIETDKIEQVENTKMVKEKEGELSVTVQEAEAEYIKSISNFAKNKTSTALNTTADRESKDNKENKAANQ